MMSKGWLFQYEEQLIDEYGFYFKTIDCIQY